MTDEQMKELAELRVAIQDLKYQLIQKHELRELTEDEIMEIYDRVELYNIDEGQMYLKPIEFAKELLKKASEK
jgi:hypothetical protein